MAIEIVDSVWRTKNRSETWVPDRFMQNDGGGGDRTRVPRWIR